jgi:DNA invertase Pin-like site-specific DNA recombinase
MLQIVEEWKNLGIDFVVTTLGLDTSTASGRFVFGVLAQTAEFERELTRERTCLAYQRAQRIKSHVKSPDIMCVGRTRWITGS